MTRSRRLLAAVAIVAGLVAGSAAPAHAASNHAVVVIGGATHVVTFDGTITGLQALQQVASVSTVGFGGQGAAVCAINGVGNPATPSQCLVGPNGEYWAYYRAAPGAGGWQYSSSGAAGTTVTEGSVEGWQYGTGGAPPFVSYCAAVGCSPPTTQPAPAAAPAGPSGSTGGDTTVSTAAGTPAGAPTGERGIEAPGTTTSTIRPDASGRSGGGQALVSRSEPGPDPDPGSPVGIAVAGGVVAGVGVGGLWIRRRRRRVVP